MAVGFCSYLVPYFPVTARCCQLRVRASRIEKPNGGDQASRRSEHNTASTKVAARRRSSSVQSCPEFLIIKPHSLHHIELPLIAVPEVRAAPYCAVLCISSHHACVCACSSLVCIAGRPVCWVFYFFSQDVPPTFLVLYSRKKVSNLVTGTLLIRRNVPWPFLIACVVDFAV